MATSRDEALAAEAKRTEHSQVLDLLAEDNRLNVYAGKLEVRPPGAPTTGPVLGDGSAVGRPVATITAVCAVADDDSQ